MPAGAKPGERRGGRQVGTPNKRTDFAAVLAKLGHDPFQAMVQFAMGKMPCVTCHGVGKTKYKISGISGTDRLADRVCESCYGSKMEKLRPEIVFNANEAILSYMIPKLKAIEHNIADGMPLIHAMQVVFVEAQDGRPKTE